MLANTEPSPLDALVPDPSGHPPLGDAEKFAGILKGMVSANAPRMFAVVQEWGDRVDARIAAWGLAFDDRTQVVGVDGGIHLGGPAPEDALRVYGFGTRITPRLVWVDPDEATPADDPAMSE